jgi:hypothetical protein
MKYQKESIGEALGTFILVLFGCGAVAVSVLFDSYSGLLQIAMVWGIGAALAIYLTRHLSCVHLNPAVSIAMVVSKLMNARQCFGSRIHWINCNFCHLSDRTIYTGWFKSCPRFWTEAHLLVWRLEAGSFS